MRPLCRAIVLAAATLATSLTLLAVAGGAEAHVSVSSPNAVAGGYPLLTFRVPTESDTASTTRLSVALPTDHPLAFVAVQPHAGWTFTVKKIKLAKAITTDDGPVTEAVSEIDWVADGGAIKPGEFDLFNVAVGPLPDVRSLSFPAIQTYSDGTVVKWIEASSPGSTTEPDHPAPVLTLDAASASSSSNAPSVTASSNDAVNGKASTGLAVTGLVVGALGIVLGTIGIALGVRRRKS